mmetsp:Transcript_24059/g.54847  ORF Transcript_24059/g.54847 Transcript_24059/m.54847 type:complete len:213 (+) Transcript_24059:111-749(+)
MSSQGTLCFWYVLVVVNAVLLKNLRAWFWFTVSCILVCVLLYFPCILILGTPGGVIVSPVSFGQLPQLLVDEQMWATMLWLVIFCVIFSPGFHWRMSHSVVGWNPIDRTGIWLDRRRVSVSQAVGGGFVAPGVGGIFTDHHVGSRRATVGRSPGSAVITSFFQGGSVGGQAGHAGATPGGSFHTIAHTDRSSNDARGSMAEPLLPAGSPGGS